jgi:predicted MFS family arabinose efflux permease
VDGFRYARQHREVRRVLTVMAAATFANMPVLVLAPVFSDQIFRKGAQGLGFLMAAMGVGAVVGTVSLARSAQVSKLQPIIAYSGIGMGVTTIAFALSPWYIVSLLIMPLIGYSVYRQMASANTTIQTLILDEYRGRIMSMYGMTIVGLGPFGSLASGALADRFGVQATTALGGLLAIGSAVAFGWAIRRNSIAA